ncbi:helix-turn-helix domain-containing protein [Streptomyces sp. G-G2]|uniref:helix-turn-helix domain-containing protein n=1 Tax=Streptomyces sp. G-G2 TaxID=3046201 RepID=UPI0024BA4294|nr:helix-turn-helix domain-containing protein [Streptomyces sp. G-G2]MDJ0382096.1 helix-turn-helix domain-containing protein [Streptomyces sp. G-G2]
MESLEPELYSVGEVAERLGLHVRTVRNYVRDGRLKAVRIGKQYRIARADFEALTRQPATEQDSPGTPAPSRGHVEVSGIVHIDPIDERAASRLSTLLTAAAQGPRDTPDALRVQTVYDKERSRMKIVILGNAADTADMLLLLDGALGPGNDLFPAGPGNPAAPRG